jgi:hypothetical protein
MKIGKNARIREVFRFHVAGKFHVIELPGVPAAGRAFASEADRGVRDVDRDSMVGVCISVLFQAWQSPPDFETGFPDTSRPGRRRSNA